MCIVTYKNKKERIPHQKAFGWKKLRPSSDRVCSKSVYTNKGCRPFFETFMPLKFIYQKRAPLFVKSFLMRWTPGGGGVQMEL